MAEITDLQAYRENRVEALGERYTRAEQEEVEERNLRLQRAYGSFLSQMSGELECDIVVKTVWTESTSLMHQDLVEDDKGRFWVALCALPSTLRDSILSPYEEDDIDYAKEVNLHPHTVTDYLFLSEIIRDTFLRGEVDLASLSMLVDPRADPRALEAQMFCQGLSKGEMLEYVTELCMFRLAGATAIKFVAPLPATRRSLRDHLDEEYKEIKKFVQNRSRWHPSMKPELAGLTDKPGLSSRYVGVLSPFGPEVIPGKYFEPDHDKLPIEHKE